MRETLFGLISQAINQYQKEEGLPPGKMPAVVLEVPKRSEHGDFATNVAMELASFLPGSSPLQVAKALVARLPDESDIIKKVEIAGPGFINFFLKEGYWVDLLYALGQSEKDGLNLNLFDGLRVQVEYVSANPTGPLHIGHGRGAAVGDALANILQACGCQVYREYYLNDAGTQMELLANSVRAAAAQALGKDEPFPADGYQGSYIREIARGLINRQGKKVVLEKLAQAWQADALTFFLSPAVASILETIRHDLASFGVHFDSYFSEKSLFETGELWRLIDELKEKGLVYEKEGALWFRTSSFGDDKDRVVVRGNRMTTYFASDVAYHSNKFDRGFQRLINVWGADHHGYVPRIKASLAARGYPADALDVVLVQMVSLVREGKPVTMSTRAGEFITLRQVIDEVGMDATRFLLLMRRSDSHLEFDLEVAKKESAENPVYYIHYAHARVASIFKKALERGYPIPAWEEVDRKVLERGDELVLIKQICAFPDVVRLSAQGLEPHRLAFYLLELAGNFHRYYLKNRVLSQDKELSKARLLLIGIFKRVVNKGLGLIGVSAPERMEKEEGMDIG
ncbi:MAG: arginine--tRNA ligase [Thermodesulfobacteriota bacterium]